MKSAVQPREKQEFYQDLAASFPQDCYLTHAEDRTEYETDWKGITQNTALAVLLPRNTADVSAMMKLCARHKIAVVPQGGNTGLTAGGIPSPGGEEAVLSLRRLNRILATDSLNATMTLEAGVILQTAQEAAEKAGLLLPLSIAAEGSAQIGGVISTNAGGIQALTYGMMRNLVLGLEVVLADGQIWNGLRSLRKDNTGLDLKHLFIGSEGTLGVITAATLRLEQKPLHTEVALLALQNADAAMEVFKELRTRFGDRLTSCEYFTDQGVDLVIAHMPQMRFPLSARSPAYMLIEFSCGRLDGDLLAGLTDCLGAFLAADRIQDAALAQNEQQRASLWALRENITEGERGAGGAIKHDIAVPLNLVARMVSLVNEETQALWRGARPNIFGHLGDGNLHVNIMPPEGETLAGSPAALLRAVSRTVEDCAVSLGGTFSAEHGIGQTRAASLLRYRSDVEIDMMRNVKRALDPAWQLNPGKILLNRT